MPESDFQIGSILKRARHVEVFDWLCEKLGKTPEQLASEMITAAVVREMSAYREAHGGGGRSGKDLEALSKRI